MNETMLTLFFVLVAVSATMKWFLIWQEVRSRSRLAVAVQVGGYALIGFLVAVFVFVRGS